MKASHPTGSSLFAPCLHGSLPHFLSSRAFPGQAFFLKSLDGLTKACLPFVVLKLPVGGEKKRIER
jgi:hypothetical protein